MAYLGVPQSKLENLTTNVQVVELSASFDGTTVTFNMQDDRGGAVHAVHDRALMVVLGGVVQKPGVDYITNGTTITFTTAPASNLTIAIRKLHGVQRIIGVNDGVISPAKLTTGGPNWNSSGNVTISGDLNVTGSFNSGANGLFWEDNERAKFGTDNDLEIYHTGVHAFIENIQGGLYILNDETIIKNAASTATSIYANANDSVSLYFNNSKKFETTTSGINVTGNIEGTGNFTLTSTSTGSVAAPEIDLFRNSTSPSDADYIGQIKFTGKQDGGGTVNYAKITGKILDASNGTEDGILEFMLRKGGSNNIAARFRSDSLQLLNGTSLTVNGNISTDANINLDDSTGSSVGRLNFGNSNDLQIYHDGSNSYIKDVGTGNLSLQTDGGQINLYDTSNNRRMLQAIIGGAIFLKYAADERFETTATGAKVTGVLEVTQEYPTIKPVLDFNFAATKTLDRRITFTRDSIATFTDDMGIVRYASNNVPRFDHNPTTGESLGLLIEESRTNLVEYGDFTTGWTEYGGTATSTTETAAPDGTFTAKKIRSKGDVSTAGIYDSINYLSNTTYTHTMWLKAGTITIAGLTVNSGGKWAGSNYPYITVNLSTGAVTASGGVSAKVTAYPDGWYRLEATGTYAGNSSVDAIWVHSQTGSSMVGNTTGYYYVWGPQAEQGNFGTSYIRTTGTTETRRQDNAKITGTNFTDFYNETEGTLYSEFSTKVNTGTTSKWVVSIRNSVNNNNYIAQSTYGSNNVALSVQSGGSTVAYVSSTGTISVDQFRKVASSFKLNDFDGADNGTLLTGDTSGAMPTGLTRMDIGSGWTDADQQLEGHIKSLKYYNKKLTDAQLQGLTQQ